MNIPPQLAQLLPPQFAQMTPLQIVQTLPPQEQVLIGILLIVLLLVIVGAQALFLLSWYRCLAKVQPQNRTMKPGLVWINLVSVLIPGWGPLWLNLILIFTLGWRFYVVLRFAQSTKKELGAEAGDGGRAMGLAYAILSVCAAVFGIGLAILSMVAGSVVWVIYWAKINALSKKLDIHHAA